MPTDSAAFWTTVAQVVPVLAITLVIEFREASHGWSFSNRAERLTQSTFFVVAALGLHLLFIDSLTHLAGSQGLLDPNGARSILVTIFFLLAIHPAHLAFERANSDTLTGFFNAANAWIAQVVAFRKIRRLRAAQRTLRSLSTRAEDRITRARGHVAGIEDVMNQAASFTGIYPGNDLERYAASLGRWNLGNPGDAPAFQRLVERFGQTGQAPDFRRVLMAMRLDSISFVAEMKTDLAEIKRELTTVDRLLTFREGLRDYDETSFQADIAKLGHDYVVGFPAKASTGEPHEGGDTPPTGAWPTPRPTLGL